jgi:sugar phosphate isomerase/epimerase
MPNPNIAIILYTVREPAREDLAGTLKRVRETGFQYVQWSGMPDLPAEEIQAALVAADLKAVAGHTPVEPFEHDLDAAIAHWLTIGVTDLACGAMPNEHRDEFDAWKQGCYRLDHLGAKLRAEGIRWSYHNHAWEFEKFENHPKYKLDILYQSTAPHHVYAELDTAWIHAGGEDPATYIRNYANRCPVIHVKDCTGSVADDTLTFTELGRGDLDWPSIYAAAQESKVEWLIYEQDTCQGDPIDSAKVSYEFLSQLVE